MPAKNNAARKPINYSTATPKFTRLPVPEHLKFYHLPTDIVQFITDLLPNMQAHVRSKFHKDTPNLDDVVEDAINSFVEYFLAPAPSREGKPRWSLYDPVQWPDQPYYKYFLKQLDYYRMSVQKYLYRDMKSVTLSEIGYDMTVDNPANQAISPNVLCTDELYLTQVDMIFLADLEEFLRFYSSKYDQYAFCFEKYAFQLFQLRMAESSTLDISNTLNISVSAVGLWQDKLRKLVARFMEEGWGALNPT
jgi:hypothetical protein